MAKNNQKANSPHLYTGSTARADSITYELSRKEGGQKANVRTSPKKSHNFGTNGIKVHGQSEMLGRRKNSLNGHIGSIQPAPIGIPSNHVLVSTNFSNSAGPATTTNPLSSGVPTNGTSSANYQQHQN